jgi:PAS domain S-box-containing protein
MIGPGERSADCLPAESAEELYEDAPCGYLTTAPDGVVMRANRTFLELAGRPADDLVGRVRFYDLLPPGAKIYYETHYWPLLQMQGTVREIALELVRGDGVRVPILVNARLVRGADDAPAYVHVTVFDATERRRYERELLRARAEADERAASAAALEHVAEGVVLLDPEGRVRAANRAAAELFGLSALDASAASLAELVPGWAETAARIRVDRPAVVPLELPSGTRWLSATAVAAPDGIVYTLRDVTAEHRLDDLRSDILAVVSHELRTPLAGVYGAAQTLAAHGAALDDASRASLIDVIAEQSGRLARVVDEILLAQQLDGGELAIDSGSVDLADLVGRIVERTRSWRTTRPVELRAPEPVHVRGDGPLLEQVLVNLLDNAVKYSPPDSTVDVEVSRTRANGRVVVTDRGPGVPPADRERIFERFLRRDPQQRSGVPGVGLGLHVARELVRRMDGRIGLLDTESGASFWFEVPLDPTR